MAARIDVYLFVKYLLIANLHGGKDLTRADNLFFASAYVGWKARCVILHVEGTASYL